MSTYEKPFDLMAAITKGHCFTCNGLDVVLVCVLCDGSAYPVRGVVNNRGVLRNEVWTLDGCFLSLESYNDLNLLKRSLIVWMMNKYYLELSNGKLVAGPFASLELACGEFAAHLVTSAMPVRLISERVVREEKAVFRPSIFTEK